MSDKIDITGRWNYFEDFGFGKDTGFADLSQKGNRVTGVLQFAEQIEGEETFIVKQKIDGRLNGSKLLIEASSFEILFNEEDIDYELDTWEGDLTSEGKIIGNSVDSKGTTGSFIMERENIKTPDLSNDSFIGLN
jgi:hypothetical protein